MNNTKVTPLFIFSLPRAGSTLLQRIIGADKAVSFTGEPWILFPLFYSMKSKGILAEYHHQVMYKGIQSFTDSLPKGSACYKREIKSFVERLYQKASSDESHYFLDKTPRYHFIVDEILETFDNAKFIFLWRNPLAISASCIETWGGGTWNTHLFDCDLYGGLGRLTSAFEKNQDRVWAINYEKLIAEPHSTLKQLFEEYLHAEFHPEIIDSFSSQRLKEGLGDPTGVTKYSAIDARPLDKWKATMGGVFRQRWCRNYLNWIGERRLKVMGYDINQLLTELEDIPISFSKSGNDMLRMLYGKACVTIERRFLFSGKIPFVKHQ